MKIATPVKAIRLKCLDCSCWQQSEVKDCPSKACILWPYRMGKRPKEKTTKVSMAQYEKQLKDWANE